MKKPYSATENFCLTLEELRSIPGFEKVSVKDGKQIIDSMAVIGEIIFSIYINQKNDPNSPDSGECDLLAA